MPDQPDQELIARCRKQDPRAQETLYKMYHSPFLKLCARYARNMEDAEQLLHDGFLRIFLKIDSYKGDGSFEGWMKRVLINTCLDFLKSKQNKASMQIHINSALLSETLTTPDFDGLRKLHFKELLGMIQSLPDTTRTVFNLYVFEGYVHKQIAAELNMSEGTSAWHMHHARNLLQKKIGIADPTTDILNYARK